METVIASEGLKYTSNGDGTCKVTGLGTCTDVAVIIPTTSPDGDSVTSIGTSAFNNCTSLESITIPEGVTLIDWGAFRGCTNLESVEIPDSVIHIDDYAFDKCTSLKSISIPDSVADIDRNVFSDCTGLTSIKMPESIMSISPEVFKDCTSLKSIIIPDTVRYIHFSAFIGCTNLEVVYYTGNEENWSNIDIMTDNECLTNATIIYNWDPEEEIPEHEHIGSLFATWNAEKGAYISNDVCSICGEHYEMPGNMVMDAEWIVNNSKWHTSAPTDPKVTLDASGEFVSIDTKRNGRYLHVYGTNIGLGDISGYDPSNVSGDIIVIKYKNAASYGSGDHAGQIALYSASAAGKNLPAAADVIYLTPETSEGWHYFVLDMSELLPDSWQKENGAYSLNYLRLDWWKGDIAYIMLLDNISHIPEECRITFTLNDAGTEYIVSDYNGEPTEAVIPSIHNDKPVTSIGDRAFAYCYSLASITLPDSIISIGQRAFHKCTSLASIFIPDSVISIGDDAFEGCMRLNSITIGDSVTSIGSSIFHSCKSLENVTIGDSVTSIGSGAFAYCTSLKNITIPDSVTSIGEVAFSSCTSLESIIIPDSVTTIGSAAFGGCTSLSSIIIPDSVTSISNMAFQGCTSLASIFIPDSVTSIGTWAFDGCESLKTVYYAGSEVEWRAISIGMDNQYLTRANRIYNYEFYTEGLEFTLNDAGAEYSVTKYTGTSVDVVIPSKYDGKPVTSIDDKAFYNCSSLTSITIPDSVTSIGDTTFYGCTSLTSVVIPDSVISIGDSAFYGCSNLATVNYTGSEEEWNAISIGSANEDLTYANIIFNYGKQPFYTEGLEFTLNYAGTEYSVTGYTGSTTEVVIPATYEGKPVISIDAQAFYNCTRLTSVTIPDSVTSIGDTTFYGCTSLTSVVIPDSVISIGGSTFFDCKNLMNVIIGNGVTDIGDWAFCNCSNITSIRIPNSVTFIGEGAFYCANLENIFYFGTEEQWNAITKNASWASGAGYNTEKGHYELIFMYTPDGKPISTSIVYGTTPVLNILGGQKAVLKCAGHKMTDNIEVYAFNVDGSYDEGFEAGYEKGLLDAWKQQQTGQ